MVAWSAALPVLKRALPLGRLTRTMWTRARRSPDPDREQKIIFLARRIYRVRPFLRRDNCLERSLVAYRFLAREGMEPRLVLGAQRSDGEVRGHAWVTIDGRPVTEGEEAIACYVPLAEFGADGALLDALQPSTPIT
jgi:hypothetical protein